MKINFKQLHGKLIAPSLVAFVCLLICGMAPPASSQQLGVFDRDRGRSMLSTLKDDIKKHYYDPGYRGIDIDARFKEADEKIEQADSNSQIFGIIAQMMIEF